ncbi:hypothetical protein PtA15_14A148 [Puccinia triticina]|nr:uncharacterized protein PtA15_14A148 [Puccinia triticina]WAQ91266.1 hypothetical protein PtA15_14A148 [Puccinia triticina]WAR62069.1 hypothetical protein PtB15_14B163 [Puccinia triticina]
MSSEFIIQFEVEYSKGPLYERLLCCCCASSHIRARLLKSQPLFTTCATSELQLTRRESWLVYHHTQLIVQAGKMVSTNKRYSVSFQYVIQLRRVLILHVHSRAQKLQIISLVISLFPSILGPSIRSTDGGTAVAQDKRVLVITQDGRIITGELKGFDQTTNIILSDSVERVYSSDEPMEEVPLGLYIVRGDHISVIGELDVEADAKIDWSSIRAEPLDEIRH